MGVTAGVVWSGALNNGEGLDGLREYLGGLEEAEFDAAAGYLEREALKVIAQGRDDPDGYAAFYRLVFGRGLPEHAYEWIDQIYQDHAADRGTVIEAFRGSTKTTTVTLGFVAYRIGKEPHKTHVLIQVGDAIAENNSKAVATIIEKNPGFKLVFPTVRPAPEVGWGANGYWVRDDGIDPDEWEVKTAANKDPTFLGVGYRSNAIIGKHPTGLLLVDDIHDITNTESVKELRKTVTTVTSTILPTKTEETWTVFIGTPWIKKDVLDSMKRTGEYSSVRTPVYDLAEGEEEGPEYHYEDNRRVRLTWPEVFDLDLIERKRKEVSIEGPFEFDRMYKLDIEKTAGIALKRDWLHEFPAEKVNPTWPVIISVDYATVLAEAAHKGSDRDWFALSIFRFIPYLNALVLMGGVREQLTQGEAELRVKAVGLGQSYLQWVAIETVGKGEEFYSLLYRTSRLPVIGVHTGKRSKVARHEKETAPLFMTNRIFITDTPDDYVLQFIREWIGFPLLGTDDTLDSVWVGAKSMFGVITSDPPGAHGEDENSEAARANPFNSLGRR